MLTCTAHLSDITGFTEFALPIVHFEATDATKQSLSWQREKIPTIQATVSAKQQHCPSYPPAMLLLPGSEAIDSGDSCCALQEVSSSCHFCLSLFEK
jgi:hypothetical protein